MVMIGSRPIIPDESKKFRFFGFEGPTVGAWLVIAALLASRSFRRKGKESKEKKKTNFSSASIPFATKK